MNEEDVDLVLTSAARNIARQQDVPFSRRVRYTDHFDHDVVVKKNNRCIYLSSDVDSARAVSALEDAVLQAARIDHDWHSEQDIKRLLRQAEEAVDKASHRATRHAKHGRYDKAHQWADKLHARINRLAELRARHQN